MRAATHDVRVASRLRCEWLKTADCRRRRRWRHTSGMQRKLVATVVRYALLALLYFNSYQFTCFNLLATGHNIEQSCLHLHDCYCVGIRCSETHFTVSTRFGREQIQSDDSLVRDDFMRKNLQVFRCSVSRKTLGPIIFREVILCWLWHDAYMQTHAPIAYS